MSGFGSWLYGLLISETILGILSWLRQTYCTSWAYSSFMGRNWPITVKQGGCRGWQLGEREGCGTSDEELNINRYSLETEESDAVVGINLVPSHSLLVGR